MATRSPVPFHSYHGPFVTAALPSGVTVQVGDVAFDTTIGMMVQCVTLAPVVWSRFLSPGSLTGGELVFSSGTVTNILPAILMDSTDTLSYEYSGTLSPDISAGGANGLDVGAVAASTLYSVFSIFDDTGANAVAGLYSLSETAPTLPAGYSHFRRHGSVFTSSLSAILNFNQSGDGTSRTIWYSDSALETLLVVVISPAAWTTISTSLYVPTTARMVRIQFDFNTTGGVATDSVHFRPSNATVVEALTIHQYRWAAVGSTRTEVNMMVDSSQDFDVSFFPPGAAATAVWTSALVGYTDEL